MRWASMDGLGRRSPSRFHRGLVETPAHRPVLRGVHSVVGATQELRWVLVVLRIHCHPQAQADDRALTVSQRRLECATDLGVASAVARAAFMRPTTTTANSSPPIRGTASDSRTVR
jgi:hypothetical protein